MKRIAVAAIVMTLAALGQAQSLLSFREDFNNNQLPATLEESGPSPIYADGAVTFPDSWNESRRYLRTKANYNTTNFIAELTVTIQGGYGGPGIAFSGLGAGVADPNFYFEPRVAPTTYAVMAPDDFYDGFVAITTSSLEHIGQIPGAVGDGTHRVRITWNHVTKDFTVAIQKNYTGGPFSPTATIGTVSAESFGDTNTRIFFGGAGYSVWDDLLVLVLSGTPGDKECYKQSVSTLVQQFGSIDKAASALGFESVDALQGVIKGFCVPPVSGHRIAHYKDGPVPVDLSTRVVAAYVPNEAGGYDEIFGTGTSAGTFTIPNVPSGFYLLRLGQQFLWTKNRTVNADYYYDFRSTAVQPVNYTTLTFDLANLNAWQDTDFFEISGRTPAFALFPGVAGETIFTGTFPYSTYLNDTTQGDKPYFLQLVTQPAGGYPFTAAARYYAPHNFVQVDGTDTTVSGTLKAINQNQTFRANINGADLADQAMAANPGAVLVDTVLALDAYPGSMARGQTVSTPDLVGYSLGTGRPPITVNTDMGDLFYGNPFPSSWPLFTGYQYFAQTSYRAPGAWNSTSIQTGVFGATTAMPTPTSPIQPLVGTVSRPSIDGSYFFANQTGIGTTPTLSWSPPKVGTADAYAIFVYQLVNNAGNTEYGQIARLQTQSTSITIPPGLLSVGPNTGHGYVFLIRTLYRPGVDVEAKPYVIGPTNATADVISGVMQP